MKLFAIRSLALAFCVGSAAVAASAPALAQAATPVTFSLDFRALGRHAAWFVALDKGYYKEAGLDVTIIPGQGTAQAIQALESGAVQFAFSDVAGLVAARANSGVKAKIISVIYQKAPYAIFSWKDGANVTKPEQLEGLEIGSGAGSFTQKVIEAFMAEKGLGKPAIFTNVDPAARVGLLAAKKIPAIETFAMSAPGVEKALGPGNAAIFLLGEQGLTLNSNSILAREDLLKDKPDLAKAFVAASLKGWKDTLANPGEAADIVAKLNKGLDRELALQEIAIVSKLVTSDKGVGSIDPAQIEGSVAFVSKVTGGAKVDAKDIYDASFLPAAK